ncbi:MAG: tRNA dihydrouridine synthase DusB [Clostridiales bacterium]|nr:tRNA dihydrouridine synthase DusB [Clostridiales bacterium]
MRIGDIEIPGRLALAPMAGVTDLAFREICREFGASLTYTEMISAKAMVYQDSKTRTLLMTGECDHPVGAQIFGNDPVCMAEAAQLILADFDVDFIDINMGCPVGKVVRNGDGSALMRDPEKAGRIVESVRAAVRCPVTVKIRRGFDMRNLNATEFAMILESSGANAITVHGRTKTQMYSGKADWNCIKDVKDSVAIPVIANGDIFTGADAERVLRLTGADFAMIGRGSLGNPWLFREAAAALQGGFEPPRPAVSELADMAQRHIARACEIKGERLACLDARRYYAWYLKGVPHAGRYKKRVTQISTFNDVIEITGDIKKNLA